MYLKMRSRTVLIHLTSIPHSLFPSSVIWTAESAVVLLKGGTTPIGDIAQACGYGTEAALRIAFRKRFGQSMRAWRDARI